jgi:hypothetical protein
MPKSTATNALDTLAPEARAWADTILKSHPELSEAGRVLVIEAARERATIAAAERSLAERGYFVEGLHGMKANPAVAVAKNARAQLLRILTALDLQEA